MKILLSIKPQFANLILSGIKKFEFRKNIFKNKDVKTVVIYATKPIGKIIGEFDISNVINGPPETVWNKTKELSGISEKTFYDYFNNSKIAYAIKIKNAIRYEYPLDLIDLNLKKNPPQSFFYL